MEEIRSGEKILDRKREGKNPLGIN